MIYLLIPPLTERPERGKKEREKARASASTRQYLLDHDKLTFEAPSFSVKMYLEGVIEIPTQTTLNNKEIDRQQGSHEVWSLYSNFGVGTTLKNGELATDGKVDTGFTN